MGKSDGGPVYLVAIDWDVASLEDKVRGKLAGLEAKQVGKLDVDADGKVKGLTSKLEALSSSAAAAVGKVSEMFMGAVERAGDLALHLGMIGAAAGVAAVTYGVAHLNVELEQANFALAAVFKAQGYAQDFAGAMGIATDQVAKMKTDVKALPGTFTELVGIMQSISIPASNAGMSADKIRQLSEKTMLFAGITGLRQDEAGAGMAQLLGGNARQTSPMARLLGFTGAAAKKLRGESGEEREKDIEKAISKYDAAREAFSHTWKAVTTAVKDDILLKLLAPATSPLFESVKGTLVSIDEWFGKYDFQIGQFTAHLGFKLKEAWEWGTETFQKWLPSIRTFASDAYTEIAGIWRKVEPVIAHVADSLRTALGDGSALRSIESILRMYAVVKTGSMLTPFLGGAASFGKGVAGLFAGGAGEAKAGVEGVEKLAPAALGFAESSAGAVFGIGALGFAALAAAGELKALADPASPYHEAATRAASDVADNAKAIWHDLIPTGEHAADSLEKVGVNATSLAGGFLGLVHTITGLPAEIVRNIGYFGAEVGSKWGMHFEIPKGGTLNEKELPNAFGKAVQEGKDVLKTGKGEIKPGGGGGGGVNIGTQVNNFTVSTTSEPSRVARTIKNAIAEKSRYPTASPWVQNFSAARSWGGG